MQKGLFTRLIVALGHAFGDLADLLADADSFQRTVAYLGWPDAGLSTNYQNLATAAGGLRAAVQTLPAAPSYADLVQVLEPLQQLLTAIDALSAPPTGVNDPTFLPAFKERLVSLLLVEGSRRYLPALYYLLAALGIVDTLSGVATATQNAYIIPAVNLDRLRALIAQPTNYIPNYFNWGYDFNFSSELQRNLLGFIQALGSPAQLLSAATPQSQLALTADTSGRSLLVLPFMQQLLASQSELLSVALYPAIVTPTQVPLTQAEIDEALTDYSSEDIDDDADLKGIFTPSTDELRFSLIPHINTLAGISLSDTLTLDIPFVQTFQDALNFTIGPQGVKLVNGQNSALNALSLNPAVLLTYTPDGPLIFVGEPNKTRFEADSLQLALSLNANGNQASVKLELTVVNSKLVINGSEGDSFFSKVLPNSTIAVPLSVSFSSSNGLRFNGANSLAIQAAPNLQVGPVLFENLVLGLVSNPQYDIQIVAHAGLVVTLGPVEVSATELGASFGIKDLSNPKDISFGFDLPKGLGIFIDSDAVLGGGYLFLDPLNHKYAGAAQLSIKEKINLSAVGILQTQLPNNPNAYSFLLLITAEFTPIQLGLGFTLNAVGGLIGINRSVNVSYLRGMVQSGQMDTLLFPPNVLGNPETAIATVENAFPTAEGRYVFGIMAKIGWGTPNLITLDAALIIELPAPVRLVLLGVLRATLPNEQAPVLRLRADFIGVVDFGAKRISFDASLVDSRVLQFALTGDAAFRLYQGENPVFLLTSGGFHPSFQPPANADLPTLRRLTLALANGNDFRLTLSSYVAITANTVQFGSRLDLYVNLPGSYYIAGFLGFDALFQFNPFRIAVQVAAGVAIKKGSSTKLSIHLRLNVTGPAPWHIDGEGSFKILFFKIKFRVNRTFGQGAAPQPLPDTDVRRLLLAALRDPKSWEVQVPAVRPANLVVLRAETDPEKLLVDPGGALSVRQRVVPLAYRLDRFGNTRPTTGNEFNIIGATVGATAPLSVPTNNLEHLSDHFAPGQFRTMSDQQKLSAPSFQAMRSGIRLGLVDGLSGGSFVTRDVEYEVRVAHSAPANTAGRAAASTEGESTTSMAVGGGTGETMVTALPRITFSDQLSRRLARNGAVGRTARSYEQRRPSRKAPDKVFWDDDTYAVVSVRNMVPHVATPFPNEASATQYLADAVAAAPELTDELQVIPSYQLPASVTSANVAFA